MDDIQNADNHKPCKKMHVSHENMNIKSELISFFFSKLEKSETHVHDDVIKWKHFPHY